VSSGATSSACEKCGRWELALQLFSELSAAQLEAPRFFRNEMDSFTTKNGDFTRKKNGKNLGISLISPCLKLVGVEVYVNFMDLGLILAVRQLG